MGADVIFWRDPRTDEGAIFVRERYRAGELAAYTMQDGESKVVVGKDGDKATPALILPYRFWREVCAALVDAGLAPIDPGTDATKKHLADTVAVRDRLLTMVEKHG